MECRQVCPGLSGTVTVGLRPLGVWPLQKFCQLQAVPPKVCSPQSGSLVSLFPITGLADEVGGCAQVPVLGPAVVLSVVASDLLARS